MIVVIQITQPNFGLSRFCHCFGIAHNKTPILFTYPLQIGLQVVFYYIDICFWVLESFFMLYWYNLIGKIITENVHKVGLLALGSHLENHGENGLNHC